MASRMERYYKNQGKSASRSSKNRDLYNSIYSYGKYSNIEGIASIDNENEVDITKVKEMLNNREKYQIERKYRKLTREDKPQEELPVISKRYTQQTDRTYDIRDILNKAKETKEPDDKERVLRNTSYDILKGLNLRDNVDKEDYCDDKEELKDLIETITNTSMLNKVSDEDLAADLLSDLKADDTKVGEIKDVKEFLKEENKKEQTMDNSFFTSSLKLNKSDFITGDENPKKANIFMTIVITILVIAIIVSLAFVVINKMWAN